MDKEERSWKYLVTTIRDKKGECWLIAQSLLDGKKKEKCLAMFEVNRSHGVGKVSGLVFLHDNNGYLHMMNNPFLEDRGVKPLKVLYSVPLPDRRKECTL